jgi:hypothetical protein
VIGAEMKYQGGNSFKISPNCFIFRMRSIYLKQKDLESSWEKVKSTGGVRQETLSDKLDCSFEITACFMVHC